MRGPFHTIVLVAACVAGLPACDAGDATSTVVLAAEWNPEIDPGDFVSTIDNPYFPLVPGTVFEYQAETDEGIESGVVEVTHDTKEVLGVLTTVVIDRVYLEGELIEETADWYAQDADGNVWYFGEASTEFAGGVPVSSEGSWEAGVDGAFPGIIMLAEPKIGEKYHQEFAPGVAEDMGQVLSLSESVSVPADDYENCLRTMDWTPLEPGHREFKYYCPGVGLVLELSPSGGRQPNELVSVAN